LFAYNNPSFHISAKLIIDRLYFLIRQGKNLHFIPIYANENSCGYLYVCSFIPNAAIRFTPLANFGSPEIKEDVCFNVHFMDMGSIIFKPRETEEAGSSLQLPYHVYSGRREGDGTLFFANSKFEIEKGSCDLLHTWLSGRLYVLRELSNFSNLFLKPSFLFSSFEPWQAAVYLLCRRTKAAILKTTAGFKKPLSIL